MLSGGTFCDWFSWKNLFMAIGILVILSLLSTPMCTEYMANIVKNKPKTEFVFYSMKNCGYCTPVRPIWKKLQSKFANNQKVSLKHYDTETNKEEIKSANIKGFPTIKAFKNGKEIATFSGNRTENDITEWILTVSN